MPFIPAFAGIKGKMYGNNVNWIIGLSTGCAKFDLAFVVARITNSGAKEY
jgi:hypothetical protein